MKNAIFVADTRVSLVGTLLEQVKEKSPNTFDEAIVYNINFTEKDKAVMNAIMPCRFIDYNPPLSEKLFELDNFKRFSKIAFARYEMFNYLNEFERIMWIDTDVVIQENLDELIKQADETGMAIISENYRDNSFGAPDFNMTNFRNYIFEYNMDKILYCSAVIILNKKIYNENYVNWLYDHTVKYSSNLILPDQGIINLFVQHFNIEVKQISSAKYALHPKRGLDCSKATIVHSWGSRKFWNNWYLYLTFPFWAKCYNKWVKKGGSILKEDFKPLISVIIPTYNPNLEYFKECLDSLMNQKDEYLDFDNFEIIIVAEPSKNNEELKLFVESYDDKRIRLLFNSERLGIAQSLNRALKEAKGDLIARMDDDDISLPQRLYLQSEYLKKNPNIHLCTTDYEYFQDMNEYRKSYGGDFSKALCLLTCPFDHPTIMLRKDFFEKNNLSYDKTRYQVEDWNLWINAFEKGMNVGCINQVLFRHRWRNMSLGQGDSNTRLMDYTSAKQFHKLGVDLSKYKSSIIRIYSGKTSTKNRRKLKRIFAKALRLNLKRKIYNQKALKEVFKIRLYEAKTGKVLLNSKKESYLQKIFSIRNKVSDQKIKYKVITILGIKFSFKVGRVAPIVNYEAKISTLEQNLNKFNCILNEKNEKLDKLQKRISYLTDDFCKYNSRKKIFIIGTAIHDNIGDAAISYAEIKFVQNFFKDYFIIETNTYEFDDKIEYLKSIINKDDIIFLQGGGNLGNRYINEEKIRRKTILSFPENKIIIFPQSIWFSDDENGKNEIIKSNEIYSAHKDLILFCRDPYSLELAKMYFPSTASYLTKDIVCSLKYDFRLDRDGVYVCIRDVDDESGLNELEHDKCISIIKNFALGKNIPLVYGKNRFNNQIPIDIREKVLLNELKKFAKAKVVVTDRLHGVIFSIITNTPCVVLKSKDHKIPEFLKHYKNCNLISYLEKDINSLDEKLDYYLNNSLDSTYSDWEEDFKLMAEIIKGEQLK